MPNSMTAFARAQTQRGQGTLTWEIRSINHRYLDTGFRLPDALRNLEVPLRERARKFVQRGKVDGILHLELDNTTTEIAVNVGLAQQYIDAGELISGLLAAPAPLCAMDILCKPGVIVDSPVDADLLAEAALDLYDQAMLLLVENRAREGGKLADLVRQRLTEITREVASVRGSLPLLLAAQRQRLTDKLAEFTNRLDTERLEQELVYLAQKADVDEELDRLSVHITEIYRVLQSDKPMGRRLDFLLQELNREANTLSSKSFSSSTTHSAVEVKVLIEQMREQIQNLE